MSKRRQRPSAETRAVQLPPAHNMNLPKEQILSILSDGAMEVQGLMPWSSNYTFLVSVGDEPLRLFAIYKPCRGERPLWDFPHGSLCKREFAAYLVSEALGWELVPPTVLRDGDHGLGSVQFFIDCDQEQHYFTLKDDHQQEFKRVAVFDALLNNTDRKGGHCLVDRNGKIWAIDHGVTFHCEPKLRTVIWDFAGQRIPKELLNNLRALQNNLCTHAPIAQQLEKLLDRDEIEALQGRLTELIETAHFPEPGSDWYTVPWPPV